MKPGEHPEFFRFPAPEGRSRESTIVLDERGRFFHDGELIENRAIAKAFARWMDVHPDNGRYILTNGYDWTYLTVLGAPFFVEGVSFRSGQVWLVLSSGEEREASTVGYSLDGDGALVIDLGKDGLFARFLPQSQLELAPYLREGDQGGFTLAFPSGTVSVTPAPTKTTL